MKAISLHQPWASLPVTRQPCQKPDCPFPDTSFPNAVYSCAWEQPMVKRFETRSWPFPPALIGQPIAIHATKQEPIEGKYGDYPVRPGWSRGSVSRKAHIGLPGLIAPLPLGAVVGSGRITANHKIGHFLPEAQADLANGIERRPIPSARGYVADFEGRIWSTQSYGRWQGDHELTGRPDKDGYVKVRPQVNGMERNLFAHTLVAEAWLGERPDGLQIRHVDSDKTNNAPWNLRYGTASENAIDRSQTGAARGHRHGRSKLSPGAIERIHEGRARGMTLRGLGQRYGVTHKAIQNILDGKSYAEPPSAVDDSLAERRYAWLIEDAAPTTERCPRCWGEGFLSPRGDSDPCPTCSNRGACDPIPAKGRQRIWNWQP